MKLRVKALITGIKEEKVARKVSAGKSNYETLFIQDNGMVARNGKQAYISVEMHEKIKKILHVVGEDRVSLSAYIQNLLEHHFEVYQDEIDAVYNVSRR